MSLGMVMAICIGLYTGAGIDAKAKKDGKVI